MSSSPAATPNGTVIVPRKSPRPPTGAQIAFDVAFGIGLPALCLVADPGILRGGTMSIGAPMLAGHAVAAYAIILPAMAVLTAWLLFPRAALVLAGPLFAGALAALVIGIVLLPFSLPLSLVGIGLLGLVPFGTAWVFFRNGLRAVRVARASAPPVLAVAMALLLGGSAIAFAVTAQDHVDQRTDAALEAALSGDAKREAAAIERLRPFGWLADASGFAAKMNASPEDPALQQRLARVWREATGQDLVHLVD